MVEIVVDPDDLRAAANEVSGAAGLVGHAYDAQAGDLAVLGQAGWSSVAMVGTVSGAWGPYLGQLHTTTQGMADGLRAMADNFVAADWRSAQHVRRAGGGIDE